MTKECEVITARDGRPVSPYLSHAIRAGDFLFVSGNTAFPPPPNESQHPNADEGGIEAETRRTLENIKATLDAAGSSLDDVVKVSAFLRDVDLHFDGYNSVYLTYFPSSPPARTTVQAKILGNILIEIDCIAYVPEEPEQ
jgi:2-iminobutanoate/2-iminopropanoate deaminase